MEKYRFHIITKDDGSLYRVVLKHHRKNGRVLRRNKTGISILHDNKVYTCFSDYNIYI